MRRANNGRVASVPIANRLAAGDEKSDILAELTEMSGFAFADIVYVTPPTMTIQYGINPVSSGDTVLVAEKKAINIININFIRHRIFYVEI